MNFKDFLMDNYIYIVIVIILIIVTIIGFLADKKKNGSNKKKGDDSQNGLTNAASTEMTYQQPNAGVPNNNLNVVPNQGLNTSVASNNMNTGNAPMPMPEGNGMNVASQPSPINVVGAPMPVEPINNVVSNPEPMYQPLSEQKPTFTSGGVNAVPPVSVTPPVNSTVNPVPVASAPVPMPGDMVDNNVGMMPNTGNVSSMAQIDPQPVPQGMIMPNPNDMVQNAPQIQQGSVPGPMPQPMPNQGGNGNPEVIPAPSSVVPTPVNFVFGAQQNNNQNM